MFNSILCTFVHILIVSLWIQQYPVHWRQTVLCMLKSTNQRRVVNCDNPLVAKFWDARSTETAWVADGDSLQHTGRSHADTVFWHPADRGVCDPQHPRPVRQGITAIKVIHAWAPMSVLNAFRWHALALCCFCLKCFHWRFLKRNSTSMGKTSSSTASHIFLGIKPLSIHSLGWLSEGGKDLCSLLSFHKSLGLGRIKLLSYYLPLVQCRLHLPGEVVEDGREKASYDVDSGECGKCHCHTDH